MTSMRQEKIRNGKMVIPHEASKIDYDASSNSEDVSPSTDLKTRHNRFWRLEMAFV